MKFHRRTGWFIAPVIAALLGGFALPAVAQVASDGGKQRRPVQSDTRRPPNVNAEQRGQRRPIPTSDVQILNDVVYASIETDTGDAIELKMNVGFLKDHGNEPMPAVILIHGGGYISGSRNMFNDLLMPLARGGYFAATIDYRLADVAPYPAAVHDCKAAVRFLRANATELGIDPARIGVMGHSAGGHLAALIGVAGNEPALEGDVGSTDVSSAVACAVDLSGPSDFLMVNRDGPIMRRIIEQWFAGPEITLEKRLVEASSITHVDSADPPMLIIHGEADRIVDIAHAEVLRDDLEEQGVEHEFVALEGVGHNVAGAASAQAIAAFLDRHLGGNAAESMAAIVPGGPTAPAGGRRPIPEEPIQPPGRGAASESKSQGDDEDDDDEPAEPSPPTTQPEA